VARVLCVVLCISLLFERDSCSLCSALYIIVVLVWLVFSV
jgi:hypothetical protein